MNTNLIDENQQSFEHNIKKEPEEEFLCILPSYNSANHPDEDFVNVKHEKEIQSEKKTKFQCKTCLKILGTKHSLRQHEKTHQKQQCKVCNSKVLPQSFEKHMQSHQNEKSERKFECKICCQKFLTNKQLYKHVKIHSKIFQCDLCGHYSALKSNLMKHLNLHLVQGQFKCFFCRKLFKNKESFRFHSRQIHGDPNNRKGLTKADLFCRTCRKEFDDVQARRSHEKSHEEKVQCSICDKKCKLNSLAKHLKIHEIKKKVIFFKCDICGFVTTRKSRLKDHLEVHLNPDKGRCNICMKIFTNTNYLKSHSKTIHNLNVEPSRLYCKVCHVKFTNLSGLSAHQFTHKDPKTCTVCFKSVKAQSFAAHMKIHDLKKTEKKVAKRNSIPKAI